MGEMREDRVRMIATLTSLPVHPGSVPINMLVRIAGTPLAGMASGLGTFPGTIRNLSVCDDPGSAVHHQGAS
jgi:hypothetical protein